MQKARSQETTLPRELMQYVVYALKDLKFRNRTHEGILDFLQQYHPFVLSKTTEGRQRTSLRQLFFSSLFDNLLLTLLTLLNSFLTRGTRFCIEMELGSRSDPTQSTFSLIDEDHTLANAIRYTLNQDPRTSFCGYSIPHPSDNRVNVRIQTTGDPAKDVFKDACQDLMVMCQHVSNTFDKAVVNFKISNSVEGMDIESDS